MAKPNQTKLIWRILLSLAALALVGLGVYYLWPFLVKFGDEAYVRQVVGEAGVWGPIVFILIHILQVIIAPIPGQVVGFVGGFLYGPVWGTVYAVIGSTVGFMAVLWLSRRLGRPFVEKVVSTELLKKFDHLISKAGSFTFFLIFLLPGFPDDLIGFVAGLTKLRARVLVLASAAGRLPGYAVLSVIGHGFTRDNLNPVIGIVIVIVVLSAVAFWKRQWIRDFVKNSDRISWARREWLRGWRKILIWTAGLGLLMVGLYELTTWVLSG